MPSVPNRCTHKTSTSCRRVGVRSPNLGGSRALFSTRDGRVLLAARSRQDAVMVPSMTSRSRRTTDGEQIGLVAAKRVRQEERQARPSGCSTVRLLCAAGCERRRRILLLLLLLLYDCGSCARPAKTGRCPCSRRASIRKHRTETSTSRRGGWPSRARPSKGGARQPQRRPRGEEGAVGEEVRGGVRRVRRVMAMGDKQEVDSVIAMAIPAV